LIVTDRGRPVAELRPISPQNDALDDRLYELAAAGVIGSEIAERRSLEYFEPIAAGGPSLSDAVIEGREDRL
jgi:antitoxin (DNA-binding transcriptional repressor) of toxin-antitoxin stability system